MEETNYTFERLPMAVAVVNAKLDALIKRFDDYFGEDNAKKESHELLDLQTAATMLGKAQSTLYGMTSKGMIPFHKRGNKLYFFKDELTKWIEDGGRYGNNTLEDFNKHLLKLRSGKSHKPASMIEDGTYRHPEYENR